MGTHASFCQEPLRSLPETTYSEAQDDFNLTTIDSTTHDPLKKFLRTTNSLQVKTLNQLQNSIRKRRKSQDKGQRLELGKLSSETIQEEIANRIRRKSFVSPSALDNMQILHMLEEQIDSLAQQRSDKGESTNISLIDRGKVFSKLKINLSSFIRIIHDSVTTHYTFMETIGQGSFGKVYRAICKRTKQQRAIKVLKKRITNKQDARFLAQFNLLSQLDHPNIVKLYEIYYYRSFYYVVMEYCRGGSIIDLIKRLKQFPQGLVAGIAQQLLSALAYLHQRNIVHRDIKLDNIVFLERENEASIKEGLLKKEGGSIKKNNGAVELRNTLQVNYHIKIIDFGTAIRREQSTAKLAGTRYYMAPEVFRGVLNEKSDIWSCGIFLYVFFTGKFPFMGSSIQELQHVVTTKTVSFIEREWKDVSIQARRLILGLLERSVEKRLSAKEALGHAWFKRSRDNEPATYSTCNLQLLERYQYGNNLVAIIENYLSLSAISQAERERLAVVFRRIDTNNDGTIEANQLISLYRRHFGEESEQQVAHILQKIDQNGSGRIDFNEFLVAMYTRKKLFLENALTNAFNHYDSNRDGFLQRSELISLLQGCQSQQIEFLLKQLDVNGDDRVSLGQFLEYMRKYS